jgi:hypothetical protein
MERVLLDPEVGGIMLLRNAGNYFIIDDIKIVNFKSSTFDSRMYHWNF